MYLSTKVRQQFFDFFKNKGHQIVDSAPIVLKDDPTLMFTNAGMNQFKDYFLGNKTPHFLQVADTQKCLRVSGKHNDLEEVGVDTYHHTMFEMLGNWSFGSYFKEETIAYSWELLTEVYKIPKDKIYVSYFGGNEKENLKPDIETKNIWKKYVLEERILAFGTKENFWEMGETGPCGPCSEIHIDCRNEDEKKLIVGKDLVNKDNPNVIEVWNLVFIQYTRLKNGTLEELKQKHVDTGMGLERLVRVLENKESNYDTDIFITTINEVEKITNKKYSYSHSLVDIAFRVIADHIRAISFTIADGQLPSNTGAGYIIRRILRRAVRYYYSHLEYKEPLLYKLLPLLSKKYGEIFPEIKAQEEFITKIILEEEQNFLKTLSLGLKKLDAYIHAETKKIDGNFVFELYDTYGFPFDLTKNIATEKNINIDENEFEEAMQVQKNRSKEASKIETFDWQVLKTEKSDKAYLPYDNTAIKTFVTRYRKVNIKGKELYQIVLFETPFYAESGGQIGDTGQLIFDEEIINVVNTKKENDIIIHFVESVPTKINASVLAKVDVNKRLQISIHHSATHLLHAALQKILGGHIQQKGSFLCDEYLRFDFSHNEKIKNEDIEQIEKIIREKINDKIDVSTQILPKEQAIKQGAKALFGEKYGDNVRVVTIDKNFSVELCGGTHVKNTTTIKNIKIIQETSVASGVRRIEAIAGNAYEFALQKQIEELKNIKNILFNPINTFQAVENLLTEKTQLTQNVERLQTLLSYNLAEKISTQKIDIKGVAFLFYISDIQESIIIKKAILSVKNFIQGNFIACFISKNKTEVNLNIYVEEQFAKSKNIDLNVWAKNNLALLINGKGGGQKNFITYKGNIDYPDEIKNLLVEFINKL